MVSTRKLPGRVKAKTKNNSTLSPDARIVGIVSRIRLYGARIKKQEMNSRPTSARQAMSGPILRLKTEKWLGREKSHAALRKAFLAKLKAFKTARELQRQLGGKTPTAFQVLAVTAIRHGLGSKELRQQD